MPVPPRPSSWFRYVAGGCARTLGRLALWSLWLVLGILLAFQVRIAVSHEIELPLLALRRIEHHLAAQGLKAHFGSARFDPQGHVLLTDVALAAADKVSPTVHCDRIELTVNPWLATAGVIDPREIRLTGVHVSLPAVLSPIGTPFSLLERGEATLSHTGLHWNLDHFRAELGRLLVTAHGPVPRLGDADPTGTPAHLDLAALNRLLRQVASEYHHLESIEGAHLEVVLAPIETAGPVADLSLVIAAAQSPKAVALGTFGAEVISARQLNLTTTLPGWNRLPESISLQIGSAQWGDRLHVGATSAVLHFPREGGIWPVAADLTARDVTQGRDRLPVVLARWQTANTQWRASVDTALWSEPLALRWEGQAGGSEGILRVDTHVSAALLAGLGTRLGRDLGAILQPSAPAPLELRVDVGPQFSLRSVRGRLESGPVGVQGVPLLGAEADLSLVGRDLFFERILLVQGSSVVRGSYWMDRFTNRYRFLLDGPFLPEGIAPWFKDWWPRFWSRFRFGEPPLGDVAIHGRWGYPRETWLFLGVDANQASIRDAHFDQVKTELFVRPHFIAAERFAVAEGSARASGSFSRRVDMDREKDALEAITFDIDSNFGLSKFVDLFGDDARSIVEPYRLSHPPRLVGRGTLRGPAHPAGPGRSIDLEVREYGDLAYLDFPLRDFSAAVSIRDDAVRIRNVQTRFAGGRVTGEISVTGAEAQRTIEFDGRLSGANLGEAIRTLDEFGAKRSGLPAPPAGGGRFQRELATGLVSVELEAKGLFGDPYSFHGRGKTTVFGSKLGEINLLGGLSSALSQVPLLNFTSIALNQAASDFELNGEELKFPRLRITGPSAEIIARGGYHLRTKRINFDTTVYPFAEQHNLIASTAGMLLIPLSAALELRLEGTLEKPTWYFTLGPTSLLKRLGPNEKKVDEPVR